MTLTVNKTNNFPSVFDELFKLFNYCADFEDTLEIHNRIDKNDTLCDLWWDLVDYCKENNISSIDNIQGVTFFEA